MRGYSKVVRDITESMRVEEEQQELRHDLEVHQIELRRIRESRTHPGGTRRRARSLQRLYNFAPVGYLMLDVEGRLLQANFTFTGLLGGIERQYLLQQPLSRYIARASQDDFQYFWQRLKRSTALQTVELRLLKADGAMFWARLDAMLVPQTSSGATPMSREYRLTVSDITERKLAEAERERLLDEVQRRLVELDTIFNAIADPMIAYNADGIVIKANPAMVLTLGRDPAGMPGVEVARILAMRHPDGTLLHERETPARALRGEAVKGERGW